jgi:two-component system, OmpR family, phosphate regulon sensor histidine kinase PhoR
VPATPLTNALASAMTQASIDDEEVLPSEHVSSLAQEGLSQEQLLLILEQLSDAVLVFHPSGEAVWCNPAFSDIVSLPAKSVAGQDLQQLFSRVADEHIPKLLQMSVIEGKPFEDDMELELKRRGQRHWYTVKVSPILKNNKVAKGVAVFQDVTQVRRTEKMRRDFVANVSHELRTPLSAITGYSETLLDGALEEGENAEEFVSIIHRHAERLSRLVQDLLDLSKLESDQPPEFETIRFAELIQKVVTMNQHSISEKNLTCDIDIEAGLPNVYGHENSIEQVLNNYLENAIKYTNANGKVSLHAFVNAKTNMVQVDVSDTGIGIEPKHIPRLFERFYRVDKARSREIGGTGLGLSIVKHIIELHGGQVWVESIHGVGSTFSFSLRPSNPSIV